jgi:putative endonuclease
VPGAPYELRRGCDLSRKRAGDRGERIALERLSASGYELVESNYRTRYGEIDLILRLGSTLVFVEVKLRRGSDYGDPLESVTPRKQKTIRSLAESYIAEREPEFEDVRFDVVGILETEGMRRVEHVKNAF